MRGPQDGLIALLQSSLRWLFKSRWRAALCDYYAGNIWRRRSLQYHRRWLVRRNAGLALGPHSGILERDSIDDRRDVTRQIGQADPVNAIARTSIVDDGLPLHESRRWCFNSRARFRIGAVPAGPLTPRVFRISRAHKKLHTRFIRGRRLCPLDSRKL